MKKFLNKAFSGFFALAAAVSFTACTSSDDLEASNPKFDPETNEVLTQFVFNVSNGNTPTTRMSEEATQALNTTAFRGIDNAMLLTEINAAGDGKTIATALTMNKDFDLAQVCAAGTLDKDNSRRVLDMSIPISTNTMLFYGKAIKGSVSSADANAGLTQDDVYGKAAAFTIDKDLSEISIKTAPRLYNGASEAFYEAENLIASILTRIIQAGRIGTDHTAINATDNAGTDNPYGFNVGTNYPEIGWIDYANPNNVSPYDGTALSPSGERLREAYLTLTTVEPGEMRAGSGDAVLRQVQDLWSVINGVRCAAPTNEGDAVAKHVAANIHSRISRYFDATVPTDGSAVSNVVWKQKDDLISNLVQNAPGQTASDYEALSNTALQMSKFPSYFNLPEGCTQMEYQAPTSATSYDQAMRYRVNLSASDMGGGYITAADYLFPFELTYFGNSPIRTSAQEHKVSDYPNGAHANEGGWDADDSWTSDWVADTHVTSETRSVAMKNDINYGSALLKTTVHYSAQVLKDNNHAMQQRKDNTVDEPDMEIAVNGTTFQLNGVLVGGQPKELGWDYIYKAGAADNNYNGMVYDHAIPDAAKIVPAYVANVNKDNLACNYTIVADNYVAAANQNKVYVALEFINNSGGDFWGEHNLIRKGGVFYLIGELDPTATTAPTWPTYHALPPYNADGSSIRTPRVFMQDYMTTAHFSIGVNSLKYAYNTVPDLRSSNASLGLSVDLKWSTGLVFEDVILGGE